MTRTIAGLQGPRLFNKFIQLNPRAFTAAHVAQMHNEIAIGLADVFARINGPALRAIDVKVMSETDFLKMIAADQDEYSPAARPESINARCVTELHDGAFSISAYYNLEALRRNAAAGQPAGTAIVHECCTTIYTPWLENRYAGLGIRNTDDLTAAPGLQNRVRTLNYAINRFVEGWANYFTGSPFPMDQLLMLDAALTTQRYKITDPTMRQTLLKVIRNPHVFGALALLKIEMAFGFNALIPSIRSPLGLFEGGVNPDHCWGDEILTGLWQFYAKANNILGLPAIPAETCLNGEDIDWTRK
jgi:hypothetical protein